MYTILRCNKKHKDFKTNFRSYEAARSAVRKYIRAVLDKANWGGMNPPISDFGFTIKKV